MVYLNLQFFKHKNGCEDLEKAKWYLEKVIKKYKEL